MHMFIIILHVHVHVHVHILHVLMRDEKEGRKKQARSNKQQGNLKQHSTPKAVTFPKKNELPRVGLEPTTLYMFIYYMYMFIYYMYTQDEPLSLTLMFL